MFGGLNYLIEGDKDIGYGDMILKKKKKKTKI